MAQHKVLFGTDGVRGHSNCYPMTTEMIMALGKAAAVVFKKHHDSRLILIGKDTRLSCYMYENALISGLCSMGFNTVMIGPIPTPGIAYLTKTFQAAAGIVISASHNPFYDNGVKFFDSEGFKLSEALEYEIETLALKNEWSPYLPLNFQIGKNKKIRDANIQYMEFVKSTFPKNLTLKGLRIVLDCANGACYKIAPKIFKDLGAEVIPYGCHPNGININTEYEDSHHQYIKKIIKKEKAHLGIAFDGDGDRALFFDEKGNISNGDIILALSANYLKEKGLLKNQTVVNTVMANSAFKKTLEKLQISVKECNIGDRHVIEEMKKTDCIIGGEPSGHLIFKQHTTTGDGMVSALQVLKIMQEKKTSLLELSKILKLHPQVILNVKVKNKPPLSTLPKSSSLLNQIQTKLSNSGRIFVRYSGTEPILRILIEGKNRKKITQMAHSVREVIQEEIF